MKRRILIIDDEPDLLMYLKTFLEDQGYEVSCAEDVQSALKRIPREKPDLICLDIMMPTQSGISFYERLRRDGPCREIPVIIISGLSEENLEASVRGMKADGSLERPLRFLNKPVDLNLLLSAIQEALS